MMRNLLKQAQETNWSIRLIFALCLIMLIFLAGMGTTAIISLIDLAKGEHPLGPDQHSGWIYSSIGIIILILLSALPTVLSLITVKTASQEKTLASSKKSPSSLTSSESSSSDPQWLKDEGYTHTQQLIDLIIKQGIIEFITLMAASLSAVMLATYMMSLGNDSVSWASYSAAAIIIILVPISPYLHIRQLYQY